jgi:large subunit ribosomal protein L6
MSRVGKLPIEIPKDVKVNIDNTVIKVEGPKGKLQQSTLPEVRIDVKDNIAVVTRSNEGKRARSMHGLYRNLLNNMIIGVSQGFTKRMKLIGVGYRAEVKGSTLILNLGYSNPVEFPIPEGITIQVDANTTIIASSIDKQQLGQVCANIRGFRPPEPYKGKGIRYEDEVVRKKVGKTGIK